MYITKIDCKYHPYGIIVSPKDKDFKNNFLDKIISIKVLSIDR